MICVKDISFSYGNKNIFKEISFEVKEREILCLIGPNGSGKSTLLDCILGLKHTQNGYVNIKDKEVSSYKPNELAKHIAYVPQKQTSSFPYKVLDMVVMGRAAHIKAFARPSEEDKNQARSALDYVGLKGFEERLFTELSGGEAQLVMIARAITQDTKVIIMDEPTSHLDYHNELMVLEVISKLVKTKGVSVIMATHFPNHAYYFPNQGISTRVGILHESRIQVLGRPSEVLTEAHISNTFRIKSKVLKHYENEKEYNHIVPLLTEKQGN